MGVVPDSALPMLNLTTETKEIQMVTPLLSRSALLAAKQLGTVAAPAVSKAAAGAVGGTARATLLGAGREAALGLPPRAATAALVTRTLTETLAPRAALPGIVKKTGTEFVESAAADLFSQVTGIAGKTSPTLGGTLYEAGKRAASFALAPEHSPPGLASTQSALAQLLEGSHPSIPVQVARNTLTSTVIAPQAALHLGADPILTRGWKPTA